MVRCLEKHRWLILRSQVHLILRNALCCEVPSCVLYEMWLKHGIWTLLRLCVAVSAASNDVQPRVCLF